MKDTALKYLEKESVAHMGMISPIKRNSADIIYAAEDGVFIREAKSKVYMITMSNFDKAKTLVDEEGKQPHICVYQKSTADYLYEKYSYRKYAENVQAAYMEKVHMNLPPSSLEIKLLDYSLLDWVYEQYKDQLNLDYIKARLEEGAIYGGYLEAELCGFAGIHEEGSIGILKVLDKFRGRGYAAELMAGLVNILLDRGDTPYSQIEHDNKASISLHKKLGFEISKNTLYRLID